MAEHDQSFSSEQEWCSKGNSWLTRRGPKVRAICYDTKGRHVSCGGDFMRATKEGAYPVRWLWPEQVAELAASHPNAIRDLILEATT